MSIVCYGVHPLRTVAMAFALAHDAVAPGGACAGGAERAVAAVATDEVPLATVSLASPGAGPGRAEVANATKT